MAEGFAIAVKGFVVDGKGELLVVKRSEDDEQQPGIWELPGGRLERSEDPVSGLLRELMEETGLQVEVVHPINVRHFTRRDGQTITMIIYLCRARSTDVTMSEEHTAYRWVPVGEARGSIDGWFWPEIDSFERFFRGAA